jgi:hypothetical protein
VDCSHEARYPPGVSDTDGVTGDDEVPKLPRGRGLRLSRTQLARIAMTLALLVLLVMTQRPCADAVSSFVTGFGDQGSAGAVMPRPDNVDLPQGSASAGSGSAAGDIDHYERLRPGMSDDEIKGAIERAKAKAARGSGAP